MRLILTKDYLVDVDNMNWTLKQVKHIEAYEKDGEVIPAHDKESILGYYPNFEQTIRGLLKHACVNTDEVLTMEQYEKRVSDITEKCIQEFKQLKQSLV